MGRKYRHRRPLSIGYHAYVYPTYLLRNIFRMFYYNTILVFYKRCAEWSACSAFVLWTRLHKDILGLEVFLDSQWTSLGSDSAFLDTSKGCHGRTEQSLVDTDHADLQMVRKSKGPFQVLGEKVRGQTDVHVVGDLEGFGFGLETPNGGDGTKSFGLPDIALDIDIGQDGGWIKVGSSFRQGLLFVERSTFLQSGSNLFGYGLHPGNIDEWSHLGAGIHSAPHLERLNFFRQFGNKLVVDGRVDQEPIRADTGLTRVPEFGNHRRIDGVIDVRVFKDDKAGVPTEFHRYPLDGSSRLAHEDLSNPGRSGETDLFDNGVGAEFGPHGRRGFGARRAVKIEKKRIVLYNQQESNGQSETLVVFGFADNHRPRSRARSCF